MMYLASVLILLWLLVGGYLVFMLTRQRALERELQSLQERLEEEGRRREQHLLFVSFFTSCHIRSPYTGCREAKALSRGRPKAAYSRKQVDAMVQNISSTGNIRTSSRSSVPEPAPVRRSSTFFHSLAFVIGFGAVFTLLGSAAGLLGQSLNSYLPLIQRLGAVLLAIFGLTTLGVLGRIVNRVEANDRLSANPAIAALVDILRFLNALMYTERRVTDLHKVKRGWGYLSSAMMGVSFSAGWVPCVGPILASILFLASDSATAVQGALLLAIFSLGLGLPFLITGAAFSRATLILRRLNRHANIVSIVSGIFLLYVAWLLWSDQLTSLTTQFAFLNQWVFLLEDGLSSAIGVDATFNAGALNAAPLAFIAGLISFISPCVLPLIPAYIGYLSGAALSGSRG